METKRLYVESPNPECLRDIIGRSAQPPAGSLTGSPAIAFPCDEEMSDRALDPHGIPVAGAPHWAIRTTLADGDFSFSLLDTAGMSQPIGYGCYHHAVYFESWAEHDRAVRNFNSAFRQSVIHNLTNTSISSRRVGLMDDDARAGTHLHDQAIRMAIATLTNDRPQETRFYAALALLRDAEARYELIQPFLSAAA